jgi:glutamate synthase domain-containing protein 3
MTAEMQKQLETLVRLHEEKTGSAKAATLLADWLFHAQKFLCFTPLPQA